MNAWYHKTLQATVLMCTYGTIHTGSFLCPPFTSSNSLRATNNYVTCNLGLCAGNFLTVGVCPNTGGTFTGGKFLVYHPFFKGVRGGKCHFPCLESKINYGLLFVKSSVIIILWTFFFGFHPLDYDYYWLFTPYYYLCINLQCFIKFLDI